MLLAQFKPKTLCGPSHGSSLLAEAVTFDYYNTLVFHRESRGRGRILVEYLENQGLQHGPWAHQVLYDVFALHDRAYSPLASLEEKNGYYAELAERVFEFMAVPAPRAQARAHAEAIWTILGPTGFEVFPEVAETLRSLRERGLKLAVISNWQSGLRHFCSELGIASHFDHILSSADVGIEKPDPRIFLEASALLGVPPERILHVGDTHLDDYVGGESAGLRVALLDRPGTSASGATQVIRSLTEVSGLVTS